MDYCPIYGLVNKSNARDLDCRDKGNADPILIYDEKYGGDSMCFKNSTGTGQCYRAKCNFKDWHLVMLVNGCKEISYEDFQTIDIKADIVDGSEVGIERSFLIH